VLCHSTHDRAGCAIGDRLFAQGIKEIADWLYDATEEAVLSGDPNAIPIIGLFLDDHVSGHDSFLIKPLLTYLGDRMLRVSDKPPGRWPTRREMLTHFPMRQVVVLEHGQSGFDAHGSDFMFDLSRNGSILGFTASSCTLTDRNEPLLTTDDNWHRV